MVDRDFTRVEHPRYNYPGGNMDYQEPPTPVQPRRPWYRHPAAWIGVVVAAAVAAGLLITTTSGSTAKQTAARGITVHGSMTVTDPTEIESTDFMNYGTDNQPTDGPCMTYGGGFSDIAEGAQVVISDDVGRTLTIAHLEAGTFRVLGTQCSFPFTAKIPAGKSYYGVTVSHRGTVKMTEAEVATAAVTLGN